jgi:hypothetical protein
MSTRLNTIGAVHWDGMWAGTTGEDITLVIPAFFRENHVPFLLDILGTKLPDLFEYETELVLDPGELKQTAQGTSFEPGTIGIAHVHQPWPDAKALREAIDDAFAQAGEVEAAQMRLADELVAHLKSAS